MTKKIPPRETHPMRSRRHQKRKMKKILKVMLIFLKTTSTTKSIVGKDMCTNRNIIPLIRTIKMRL